MKTVASCWQPCNKLCRSSQQAAGVAAAPSLQAARAAAARPAAAAAAQRWRRRWHPSQQQQQSSQARMTSPCAAAASTSAPSQVDASVDSDLSGALSLDNIRQTLIRLEDTIIFSIIERAQFARNDPVYQPDAIPVPWFRPDGRRFSLLEYTLRSTEQLHGKIRRYTSPDEHAFYPEDLPALVLPPISYDQVLAPFSPEININQQILGMYLEHLLPQIAAPGDDHNYGSSAMHDVTVLQALSKRIHYGMFVAEAKFRKQRGQYTELIQRRDTDGIMELLTDRAVEAKVIERVRLKAATFGQDLVLRGSSGSSSSDGGDEAPPSYKVRPEVVAQVYEHVIRLTKDVEVLYLLRRLEHSG